MDQKEFAVSDAMSILRCPFWNGEMVFTHFGFVEGNTSMNVEAPECPHCGTPMRKWHTPQMPFGGAMTWTTEFLYICFNDECPYFVSGWDWMWNNYHRRISYRHMLDPSTGGTSPIAVSSYDSLKEGIIDE